MLTVCLPVHNYDVRPLVRELDRQRASLPGAVRILVLDDGSDAATRRTNAALHARPELTYRELGRNLGRAAVRNRLAREAAGDWLLFLDADGQPGPELLANYLRAIRDLPPGQERDRVFVGGRNYAPAAPPPPHYLHWYYGTHRESQPPSVRNRRPYAAFHTNNFLAPRGLLLRHPFATEHAGYGHEDTLWGQQLRAHGATVLHLDNPVVHLGLEAHRTFLDKQRAAIRNLAHLRRHHPELRTRLTDFATANPRLAALAARLPEGWLLRQLNGPTPNLRALDLLKLRWWRAAQLAHPPE